MTRKKTHAEYVAQVAEKHEGKIEVIGTYSNAHTKIEHRCTIDGHVWESTPQTILVVNRGCHKCSIERNKSSAGKRRCPRPTESEKQQARAMRAAGMSYLTIGSALNRSDATIRRWCDSAAADSHRACTRSWRASNVERQRAAKLRYQKEFLHGRLKNSAYNAGRRGNYRQYDDTTGELICQEWESYHCTGHDPEAERKLLQLERRLRDLNKRQKDGKKWSLEHLLPLSLGGTHQWWNLAIRPLKDNISKNASINEYDMSVRTKNIASLFA